MLLGDGPCVFPVTSMQSPVVGIDRVADDSLLRSGAKWSYPSLKVINNYKWRYYFDGRDISKDAYSTSRYAY